MGGYYIGVCVCYEVVRFLWLVIIDGGSILVFWQVLLVNMVVMYVVYYGLEGLKIIVNRVYGLVVVFSVGVSKLGLQIGFVLFFDIVKVIVGEG